MKYRPIGLPLRSRPRRCSSVAVVEFGALGPRLAAARGHGGSSWPRRPPRRIAAGRPVGCVAAADPDLPSTRAAASTPWFAAGSLRRRRRAPCRRRPGRRRGRDGHRVADAGLAHQRLLGRLGGGSALAHRLGQLDVVAIVVARRSPAGRTRLVAGALAATSAALAAARPAAALRHPTSSRGTRRRAGRRVRRGVAVAVAGDFGRTFGVGVIHGRSGPFWDEQPRRRSAWHEPSARCSGVVPIVNVIRRLADPEPAPEPEPAQRGRRRPTRPPVTRPRRRPHHGRCVAGTDRSCARVGESVRCRRPLSGPILGVRMRPSAGWARICRVRGVQRIRRMWTDCTSPNRAKYTISPDPP